MSQTHAVEFTKYHGTGNDFLVVDATDRVPDRAAFARAHCDRQEGVRDRQEGVRDRQEGVHDRQEASSDRQDDRKRQEDDGDRRGADGVLFLGVEDRYSPARVVMTLVQPDGSTAAMCGNGARCAAAWAHERTGETEFMIDTQAGTRHAFVDPDGARVDVDIEMGVPTFGPAEVPVEADAPLIETEVEGLTVTAVNTGVPHAVAFVEDVDGVDLETVAEPVRHAAVFPEGANVNLASPVRGGTGAGAGVDASEADVDVHTGGAEVEVPVFDQRTFERGVEDETRSCGTGAVAIAAVAKRLGRVEGDVVHTRPPGGELEVRVPDDGPAWLSGPVEEEYAGTLPADPR